MKYEIAGNPDQGDLTVGLEAGETILTESGAMSRMSAHMEVKARLIGGFVKAVARKLLGGESLFLSEYQAAEAGFVSISFVKFSGTGKILVQSHNISEFGRLLGPKLPQR